MSKTNGWPSKYPWRHLPQGGIHPFVLPKGASWINPPRGSRGGYLDADGNEWRPHPDPSGAENEFHWDVEHADGRHSNVRPDGEIHHGDDNFP